ncbi:MAG: PIN domain-containing protein [Thermodesulfobacteriota bacterium]
MYLLDTNVLSELAKKRPNTYLLSHLSSKPSQSLFTSSVCVMELRLGCTLRGDFVNFWSKISKNIISRVNVVSFGYREALIAGDILASLKKTGQSIGIEDAIIGSTALNHNLVMVTANIRHFSKIKGLVIENWLTSSLKT